MKILVYKDSSDSSKTKNEMVECWNCGKTVKVNPIRNECPNCHVKLKQCSICGETINGEGHTCGRCGETVGNECWNKENETCIDCVPNDEDYFIKDENDGIYSIRSYQGEIFGHFLQYEIMTFLQQNMDETGIYPTFYWLDKRENVSDEFTEDEINNLTAMAKGWVKITLQNTKLFKEDEWWKEADLDLKRSERDCRRAFTINHLIPDLLRMNKNIISASHYPYSEFSDSGVFELKLKSSIRKGKTISSYYKLPKLDFKAIEKQIRKICKHWNVTFEEIEFPTLNKTLGYGSDVISFEFYLKD